MKKRLTTFHWMGERITVGVERRNADYSYLRLLAGGFGKRGKSLK